MIALPAGFDYMQLLHDFFTFAAPFAVIAGLFSAAVIIKKAIRNAI